MFSDSSSEHLNFPSAEIADVWGKVQVEHPELSCVELAMLDDNRFQGGYLECPTHDGDDILVYINDATREKMEDLMTHRKRSVEMVAKMLDITPEQVSPTLLTVFIFLHEAGHAYDYICNFLNPNVTKLDATIVWNLQSERDMASLPIPNFTPSDLKALFDLAEITSMEILDTLSTDQEVVQQAKDNPQKSMREQEVAYKALESEQFADEFAANVIHRHNLIEILNN